MDQKASPAPEESFGKSLPEHFNLRQGLGRASTETKLREATRFIPTRDDLRSIAAALRSLNDFQDVLDTALQRSGAYLGLEKISYASRNTTGDLTILAEWPSQNAWLGSSPFSHLPTHMVETLLSGTPLVVSDTLAAISLVEGGTALALIVARLPSGRIWLSEQTAFLEIVAEYLQAAVLRSQAQASLQRNNDHFQKALQETEERLELSQQAGGIGLWDWDIKTNNVFWSRIHRKLTGVLPGTPGTIESFINLIHPEDQEAAIAAAEIAIREKTPLDTEFRIIRPSDGSMRWMASRGEVIYDEAGKPIRLVGVNIDITASKEISESSRESTERLHLALAAARMGDWNLDAIRDIVTLSDRAADIFGVPRGQPFKWQDLAALVIHADPDHVCERKNDIGTVKAEQEYDLEHKIRRPSDGAEVWIASKGVATFDLQGRPTGLTGVIQDITENKEAQERQQLLIRELHHRVKNTLSTVQAIVTSAARTATSVEEFHRGFVGRIVSLASTHNLLTEDDWQTASLIELLNNELGPYDNGEHKRVELSGPSVELPSDAAVPIGMAIHELTTNAAKHGALSRGGGSVVIRWSIAHSQEGSRTLKFSWSEIGGPTVEAPKRQGFGSRLLQRLLATQLQAQVKMDFRSSGLHFDMTVPLSRNPPLLDPLS